MTDKVVNFSNDRITLREGDFDNIPTAMRRIIRDGWVKITIGGSEEMKRAAWLEAKVIGLEVLGYNPSIQDRRHLDDLRLNRKEGGRLRKSALEIYEDYTYNIIPTLHKNYNELAKKRTNITLSNSKLTRFDSTNNLQTSTQLDEVYEISKRRLKAAIDQQGYFLGLGDKILDVEKSFKDGIPEYYSLEQTLNQSQTHVRGNLLTKPKPR